MEAPLIYFASVIVLALLAGTLRSVKVNLMRRPAIQIRPFSIFALNTVEGLLWLACSLGVFALAPHPITIVLVALIFVSIMTAGTLRYREEKRAMNRWIQLAPATECTMADMLDSLANSCRSRLALRAKSCINRLNRGETVEDAVRRAKLPLDGDAVAALMLPYATVQPVPDRFDVAVPVNSSVDQDPQSQRTSSLIPLQLTYVIVTVFLAWIIGILVRENLVPMYEDLFDEFDIRQDDSNALLDWGVVLGNMCMFFLVVWLLAAGLVRWLPSWMARLVPWFGRNAIDHWRSDVLGCLGRGTQSGHADSQILQSVAQTSRVRWIRVRCGTAFRSVEAGTQLPTALRLAKIISGRELVWLTCADNNASLPEAIDTLHNDIRRRRTHRWRIRMAWVVPLATVLVGCFVLIHAGILFHFMAMLIRRIA